MLEPTCKRSDRLQMYAREKPVSAIVCAIQQVASIRDFFSNPPDTLTNHCRVINYKLALVDYFRTAA